MPRSMLPRHVNHQPPRFTLTQLAQVLLCLHLLGLGGGLEQGLVGRRTGGKSQVLAGRPSQWTQGWQARAAPLFLAAPCNVSSPVSARWLPARWRPFFQRTHPALRVGDLLPHVAKMLSQHLDVLVVLLHRQVRPLHLGLQLLHFTWPRLASEVKGLKV